MDPDPAGQSQCGPGSTTLAFKVSTEKSFYNPATAQLAPTVLFLDTFQKIPVSDWASVQVDPDLKLY